MSTQLTTTTPLIPFDPAKTPHLIAAAMKEYDALRKEVDARTDKTKTYGWPVILVALGVAASYKPKTLDPNFALMCVPAVAMMIAAFAANATHDTDRARKGLALVEDRVFILSGQPVLCHESGKLSRWKGKSRRRFFLAVFAAGSYLLLIVLLGQKLVPHIEGIDAARKFLLYGVLLAPVIFFFYNAAKSYRLHRRDFRTQLLAHMEQAKTAPPDGTRLVYSTDGAAKAQLESTDVSRVRNAIGSAAD